MFLRTFPLSEAQCSYDYSANVGQEHWKDACTPWYFYWKFTTSTSSTQFNALFLLLTFPSDLEICKIPNGIRGITHPVFLSSPLYQTMAMSHVFWWFRAQFVEQVLAHLSENSLHFFGQCTNLLLRSADMVNSDLSVKGSQLLECNFHFEVWPLWKSPAFRAAPWGLGFFPAEAQAGTAKAVLTVNSDRL